jgi:6-pyruvoyltetrahydropterin/6-carboxytetrahydropterin synthase
MMLVEKTVVFYAAHSVTAFGPEHKCSRLHGHTYTLTVWVETDIDKPVEFSTVEHEVRCIVDTFDHSNLNDHATMIGGEPTVERLVWYIGNRLKQQIPVRRVRLQETQSSAVCLELDRC